MRQQGTNPFVCWSEFFFSQDEEWYKFEHHCSGEGFVTILLLHSFGAHFHPCVSANICHEFGHSFGLSFYQKSYQGTKYMWFNIMFLENEGKNLIQHYFWSIIDQDF